MLSSMGISLCKRSQSPKFGTNGPTGNPTDDYLLAWMTNFNNEHPATLASLNHQADYFASSSAPPSSVPVSYALDHRSPIIQAPEDQYDMYYHALPASSPRFDDTRFYSEQKYLVPPSSGSFFDSSQLARTSPSAFSEEQALHSRYYSGIGLESGSFYGHHDSTSPPQPQEALVKVEGEWRPLPSTNNQRQFYAPISAPSFVNYAGGIQTGMPFEPPVSDYQLKPAFMPASLPFQPKQEVTADQRSISPAMSSIDEDRLMLANGWPRLRSPAVRHKWLKQEVRRDVGDLTPDTKIHGVPLKEVAKIQGAGVFKVTLPKKEGDGVKKPRERRRPRALVDAENMAKLLKDKSPSPPKV